MALARSMIEGCLCDAANAARMAGQCRKPPNRDRDVLGGIGGRSPMKKTIGAATVNIIAMTRSWRKDGFNGRGTWIIDTHTLPWGPNEGWNQLSQRVSNGIGCEASELDVDGNR